jgi:homocysteine S-methyltransferase
MSPSATVLDGGLSNALESRGHDLSGPLWTARLLLEAPDEIGAVHRAYFAAGARIVTTASYQASVDGFLWMGLRRHDAEAAIRSSVSVARLVRDELADDGVERRVAASVGPYGAVLADGSEYRGRYGVSAATLRSFHRARLEVLAAAQPDLFAVETIPDVDEAEVLVDLLDDIGLPAWFSYSAAGLRTRAGQPLADAFRLAGSPRSVIAVGVNCCDPDDVLPAVRLAVELSGKPAVAYPNRGQSWDAARRSWTGTSVFNASLASPWVHAGARFVGGCCQVGPTDIAALVATLGSGHDAG